MKINEETGEYDDQRARVSFIGYAPVNDPKIALIVVVDDPQDYYQGGGFVAPVMFKEIVSKTLRYMNVPTTEEKNQQNSTAASSSLKKAPNVQGLTLTTAKERLAEQGYLFETIGSGNGVKRQYPEPGDQLASRQRVYLLTDEPSKLPLPDLTGKSLRDVMELCSLLEWKLHVEGEGYVVGYDIATQNNQRDVYVKLAPKSP